MEMLSQLRNLPSPVKVFLFGYLESRVYEWVRDTETPIDDVAARAILEIARHYVGLSDDVIVQYESDEVEKAVNDEETPDPKDV